MAVSTGPTTHATLTARRTFSATKGCIWPFYHLSLSLLAFLFQETGRASRLVQRETHGLGPARPPPSCTKR